MEELAVKSGPASISLRPGRIDDALDLAELVNMAGEGLPYHLWSEMSDEDDDPLDVGSHFVCMDNSAYSWRNSTVALFEGHVAGAIVTKLIEKAENANENAAIPFLEPVIALEQLAPGTRHISFVATFPEFRCKGLGSGLLAHAETQPGPKGMSLVVAGDNEPARRLYEQRGYRETSRRPATTEGWTDDQFDWVLMQKQA